MVVQIAGHGELAAVERGVANPAHPVLGLDDHGDEVATRGR